MKDIEIIIRTTVDPVTNECATTSQMLYEGHSEKYLVLTVLTAIKTNPCFRWAVLNAIANLNNTDHIVEATWEMPKT